MKTIHKYSLVLEEKQTVAMPLDSVILTVQMQSGVCSVWAEVDTDNPMGLREFFVAATGGPLPPSDAKYVATVQDGIFVWHIYTRD